MTYKERHQQYVTQVNDAIDKVAAQVLLEGSAVSEAALYSLQNGGKRVRGVLTLAVCDMLDGNKETAAYYAAAVEMIHAFSLIHDDLPCMDDDDMRRGKPACHIAFGETNALLAGDLLALEAFEALALAPGTEASQHLEAVRVLSCAAGAKGMIYGQELDIKYENQTIGEQELHQIQRYKTMALIVASATLGAVAAGKKQKDKDVDAVISYAERLGLVFQIVDDILDTCADEALLGKPVGSDAESHKTTYASLLGVGEAKEKAAKLTQEALDSVQAAYGIESAGFLTQFGKELLNRVY